MYYWYCCKNKIYNKKKNYMHSQRILMNRAKLNTWMFQYSNKCAHLNKYCRSHADNSLMSFSVLLLYVHRWLHAFAIIISFFVIRLTPFALLVTLALHFSLVFLFVFFLFYHSILLIFKRCVATAIIIYIYISDSINRSFNKKFSVKYCLVANCKNMNH